MKADQGTAVGPQPSHGHTGAWVAGVLRACISDGQLSPGTKLSEQELSETLGVSRNTLREAFTVLATESVIQRLPNRGVFVATPKVDDVQEIYSVFRLIEPAVVLWARISDDELEELDTIVAKGHTAKGAKSAQDISDANQEFHKKIVSLSRSDNLQGLMSRVQAKMRLLLQIAPIASDVSGRYVGFHEAVLHQLRAGRRLEAAEELRGHLHEAERHHLAQLKDRNL